MALSAANTTIAAGAAGLSTLFIEYYMTQRIEGTGRFDLLKTMNGVLGGLVAVTAGCAVIEPWASLIVGFFAGICYLASSWALVKFRLDDAVDAIPVHMVNGIWGMIAVGLFATPERLDQAFGTGGNYPGIFYPAGEDARGGALLKAQVVGVLFITAWAICTMTPFFMFLERTGSFRVAARAEVAGLDQQYFGGIHAEDGITEEQITAMTKSIADHMSKERRRARK